MAAGWVGADAVAGWGGLGVSWLSCQGRRRSWHSDAAAGGSWVAGLAVGADAAALGSPPALGVLWLKRCDERRLA